jgi:hypothetical protein
MFHSKADQLPLPIADRDYIALEYHLALATLHAGRGDCRVLSILTGVLVTTHYLMGAGIQASAQQRGVFAAAQTALNACNVPAAQAGCWRVSAADGDALGALLTLHDRQLAHAPRHCVARAVAQRDAYWCRRTEEPQARRVA